MEADIGLEPIRRAITVECSQEHAFRTFTEGIGSWWPVHTNSIGVMGDGSGAPVDVVLEQRPDGELGEVAADGTHKSWGRVLVWEPPHRLVLHWNPAARYPTEVEVRFVAQGGVTRVELEHRAWEQYGEEAEEARQSYINGWPGVLASYEQATAGA